MCITVSEYEYATGRVHVFLVKSRYPPIPMEVPDQLRSGRVFVPTNSSLLGLPGVIVTPPELRVNIGEPIGESENGIYYRTEDTDAGSTAGFPARRPAAVMDSNGLHRTVFTTGNGGLCVSDQVYTDALNLQGVKTAGHASPASLMLPPLPPAASRVDRDLWAYIEQQYAHLVRIDHALGHGRVDGFASH